MRSDIAQGDGMYRSADGGRTWTHVGLDDTQQIGRILVHPRDSGPRVRRGARPPVRSQRGARRVPLRRRRPHLGEGARPRRGHGAIDLAFEPGNPHVVYAALWQTRRPPWNVYPPSNGPGSGLYRRRTAATLDAARGNGLPAGSAASASRSRRPSRSACYAIVDAEQGGLYRSDDRGATGRASAARRPHLAARLVLRRHHGRSEARRRRLRAQHQPVPLG